MIPELGLQKRNEKDPRDPKGFQDIKIQGSRMLSSIWGWGTFVESHGSLDFMKFEKAMYIGVSSPWKSMFTAIPQDNQASKNIMLSILTLSSESQGAPKALGCLLLPSWNP